MFGPLSDPRTRVRSAAAIIAIGVHLIVMLLLLWERPPADVVEKSALAIFDPIRPAEPDAPPPPRATRRSESRPKDAASRPNLRSEPSALVVPVPIVPPVLPPPVIAAPVSGSGTSAEAGAATVAGSGIGAGGEGGGRGGGGAGGSGNGYGGYAPPRRVSGRLRNSDYPDAARLSGTTGRVAVRYRVGDDGRVSGCAITRSSGDAELDATTCRLITQRFRFRPSRDPDGLPVPSHVVENHDWLMGDAR